MIKIDTVKTNNVDEIKKVVRKENQAMIHNDQEILKETIAPDAVMEHITGVKQTRDEWLKQINLGRMKYYASKEDSLQVKIDGDRAIADAKNILDARVYGFRNQWRLEAVHHLKKMNGKWQIVASKASMY